MCSSLAMSCCTVEKRKASAKKYVETVVEDVEKAYEKILAYVRKTALNRSLWLSDESTETDVYFKMESEQVTGSLKARGAFNKISEIKASNEALEEANQINIITASSGNHGLACAHAMKKFGVQGKIFVPDYAAKDKTEAIRKHGGELEIYGDDYVEAESRAKQSTKEINNAVYFSSYNSTEILHAQATIGLEILEDLPSVDSVFISVGSGGLISSIATYMKAIKPSVKIVGCQALNSCVMFKSYKAGKVLDIPSLPTLADGTAGKFDPDAFTFDLCCEYVDKWILVSEDEISEAMYFMLEKEHKLVEGSAALCVAAFKKEKENHKGENIVLLMCGGNVGVDVVKNVLETNNNVRK